MGDHRRVESDFPDDHPAGPEPGTAGEPERVESDLFEDFRSEIQEDTADLRLAPAGGEVSAQTFLDNMRSYIGIRENPARSNRTPIGDLFGWNGVAWCAETVSIALCGFRWNGARFDRTDGFFDGTRITLPHADYNKGWANVQSVKRAFERMGRFGRQPVAGSLVCFQWSATPSDSHIGAVEKVNADGTFGTIEGNYQDRCDRWTRGMNNVLGFCYAPYTTHTEDGLGKAEQAAIDQHLDRMTAHLDKHIDDVARDLLRAIRALAEDRDDADGVVDDIERRLSRREPPTT